MLKEWLEKETRITRSGILFVICLWFALGVAIDVLGGMIVSATVLLLMALGLWYMALKLKVRITVGGWKSPPIEEKKPEMQRDPPTREA